MCDRPKKDRLVDAGIRGGDMLCLCRIENTDTRGSDDSDEESSQVRFVGGCFASLSSGVWLIFGGWLHNQGGDGVADLVGGAASLVMSTARAGGGLLRKRVQSVAAHVPTTLGI